METLSKKTIQFGASATIAEMKISLESLPGLESLELNQSTCTANQAIASVIIFVNPYLKRLKLNNVEHLADEDLILLSERCSELTDVFIDSCRNISHKGLIHLLQNCRGLQSLSLIRSGLGCIPWALSEYDFTNSCLRSKITALSSLQVVNFPRLNDATLDRISQTFRTLTSANLSYCSAVGDNGVRHLIMNCPNLTSLTLVKTGVTDETLRLVSFQLKSIAYFNVSGCPQISDDGIQAVAQNCCHLKSIDASKCSLITEQSLVQLTQHCNDIREIVLSETNVSKIPESILWCTRLERLDITNTTAELPYQSDDNVIRGGLQEIMEYFSESNLTFRLRMFVLGPSRGGKTTLLRSILFADQNSERKNAETMHVWFPFRDPNNESLVTKKLDPSERALTIDVYDIPGTAVCSKCVQPFVTPTSLPLVVFDISDNKSCSTVLNDISYVQSKLPRIPLLLIGMHADRIPNEDERNMKCEKIKLSIKEHIQNLTQELTVELDTLRERQDVYNVNCTIVRNRISWLKQRLQHLAETTYYVITASNVTKKGLDDVKKTIFDIILNSECFPHTRRSVKEKTVKLFHQLLNMKKEKPVIDRKDIEKSLPVTDVTGDENANVVEELTFLADVGVIQTVNCNRPLSSLICIDPPALLRAILSIHIDNPNQTFQFEAKRFWPKDCANGKPSPGLLVRALEEIALRGYIRECVFPLIWQDIIVDEQQIRKIVVFLEDSCFLLRENGSTLSPSFTKLVSPKFPGLSSQQMYHMPMLDLMSEEGPTLNWTPEPFKGDIQLCWRYRFFSREPPGLFANILSFCRTKLPKELCKLHWRKGLLLKLGQVLIKLSRAVEDEHCFDVTSRVTSDEEGDYKATQVMWSRTANVLVLIHQFLQSQCYTAYKILLVPCPIYFTVNSDEYDNWPEVPLHLCLHQMLTGNPLLNITIGEFGFSIDVNLLLPCKAHADEDVVLWLFRLSSENITLSEEDFSKECLQVEVTQSHVLPNSTWKALTSSPSPSLTSNATSSFNSQKSLGKEKKLIRKGSSLKWDIPNERKFTEEEKIQECKRVASGFVAVILAEAIVKHVTEVGTEFGATILQGNELCRKVAQASARAARAAQTGDAEGTAKAIMAAIQAVHDRSSEHATPSRLNHTMKSKLCLLL